MNTKHDYVPSPDGALLNFSKTLYDYALANFDKWAAPTPKTTLEAPLTAFEAALTVFQMPNHGKVDTLAKNEAKKALIAQLRVYIQAYIARNPAVTDEDKERMNLPLRDTIPTPHPAPVIKPETEAVPAGSGRHTVTALNPKTRSKDKPALVTGVAFAHKLRDADAPHAQAEEMPSEYQTSVTRAYQWQEADYGKVVDYAVAYETSGGKRGPWSDVVSVIVA